MEEKNFSPPTRIDTPANYSGQPLYQNYYVNNQQLVNAQPINPQIKLQNASLPKRCEICHQADMFDGVQNYCVRCSTFNQSYLSAKENAKWADHLVALAIVQLLSIFIAAIAVFIEIETILVSGLVVSILGAITAYLSYRCKNLLGIFWGSSAILISLVTFFRIFISGWSPAEATVPIACLILGYVVSAIPIGIKLIIEMRQAIVSKKKGDNA